MTSVLSSREYLTRCGQVGRIGPNHVIFIRFLAQGVNMSLNSKITLVLGTSELHIKFTAKNELRYEVFKLKTCFFDDYFKKILSCATLTKFSKIY